MIVKIKNLDLKQVAESGQCFRWKKIEDDIYAVPAFGEVLVIKKAGANSFDLSCDEESWDNIWSSYFDMDTKYEKIGKLIKSGDDEHLKLAYEKGQGIRILRQNLWEMIFSFMVSQNNNISRISKSIDMFCERASVKYTEVSGMKIYAFPSFNEIDLSIFDDKSLGFGYRAPYLKEICEYVTANPSWLSELSNMNYDDAMKSLMARKGIGAKVANCICLFGLHLTDSFPIDTHVKQILDKHYQNGFDFDRYQGIAGIIQQYLFYYDLKFEK